MSASLVRIALTIAALAAAVVGSAVWDARAQGASRPLDDWSQYEPPAELPPVNAPEPLRVPPIIIDAPRGGSVWELMLYALIFLVREASVLLEKRQRERHADAEAERQLRLTLARLDRDTAASDASRHAGPHL